MRSRSEILSELLVLRVQTGERGALGMLVKMSHPDLVRRAFRSIRDVDAAQDIAQETWIAVMKGISKLDDPARFQPWMHRIMRNKCADWIRRNQSRRVRENAVAEQHPVVEEDGRHDQLDALRSEIRQLPSEQQNILTLFYLKELGVAEISARLDIPEGTVKSRLFNARNMLRRALER